MRVTIVSFAAELDSDRFEISHSHPIQNVFLTRTSFWSVHFYMAAGHETIEVWTYFDSSWRSSGMTATALFPLCLVS